MKFKEIFDKYKQGDASEEEIEFIEEEIEKNQLINDYLSEDIFNDIENDFKRENNNEEIDIKNVKKTVNKKLRRVIFSSVTIILALFLSVKYIAFPLYNSRFYSPIKATTENDSLNPTWELFADMRAFSTLHFPGIYVSGVSAEARGLGEYYIDISLGKFLRGELRDYKINVVRNKVKEPSDNINEFPMANAFYGRGGGGGIVIIDENGKETYNQPKSEFEGYIKEIGKLPQGSEVSTYVSFKEDLSLEDLQNLEKEYGINFSWIGVATENPRSIEIGFDPAGSGVFINEGAVSEEEYPYFELGRAENITVDILETHFKSMVKYMSTREEFISAIFNNVNGISSDYYKEVLEYIETNGIKSYGVLIYADKDNILEFLKSDIINSLFVDYVRFSSLQTGW